MTKKLEKQIREYLLKNKIKSVFKGDSFHICDHDVISQLADDLMLGFNIIPSIYRQQEIDKPLIIFYDKNDKRCLIDEIDIDWLTPLTLNDDFSLVVPEERLKKIISKIDEIMTYIKKYNRKKR